MSKDVPFEQILRPLFEARAVAAWLAAMIWCLGWGLALNFGGVTIFLLVILCGSFAAWRFSAAHALARKKLSLIGKPVELISAAQLLRAIPKFKGDLWLGMGYRWEPQHAKRAHEVMKWGVEKIYPPRWMLRLLGETRDPATERGLQWIHGLEQTEANVMAPMEALKGHCAVLATTGAIKTRLVSLIVFQLVARGDAVIVIDPKGDLELKQICKACCEAVGHPERFLTFHPAFASESTRLDLLKNWDRVSEVASRIQLVLGAQDDSTFKDFCWNAVHSITNGMKYVGRRVSIYNLKTAMQSRITVERLTEEALAKFFREKAPSLSDRILEEISKEPFANKKPGKQKGGMVIETNSVELTAMIQVFNRDLAENEADARKRGTIAKPEEIRGLIAILEANKEWFGKMIVSITPMLTKLSTDDLKDLLSPDYENLDDQRPIMDMARIVNGKHCFYLGTDALADSSVGSALAAMVLADLASVAAGIYSHGNDADSPNEKRAIHLLVDEMGDVMCEPLIEMANKGRGAGLNVWALGQTFSDLVDAFGGDQAKAYRFMGNMNNLIVGATHDSATMKLVTEKFGMTTVEQRSQSQATGSKTEDTGLEFSVNRGESISERVTELFPPSLLPGMPDLQYVAMLNRSEFIKGRIPVLQL